MSKKENKNTRVLGRTALERPPVPERSLPPGKDLSMQKYDSSIVKSELRQDTFMLFLILAHWPLSIFLMPYSYGTQIFGWSFGTAASLIAIVSYLFLRRSMVLKIINGQLLMVFSAIFITQQFGRIEMHEHIFVALSFLLIYRNWKPIVFAGTTTAVHHVIFNYCQIYDVQVFGIPLIIFNYGYGLEIIFWHAFWAIFQCSVLAYMSERGQGLMNSIRTLMEKQIKTSKELMKEREKALNNFLRVSDQGIFSFDKNLQVEWGYSKECEDVLAVKGLEGKSIPKLFYKDEREQQEFQKVFQLIFENNVNAKEAFGLLDEEISLGDKELSLEYTRLDKDKIICVMSNITEKKKLRTRLKAEQELHENILKIISNNKFFSSFLREAESLFNALDDLLDDKYDAAAGEKNLVLRVHDFKANSAFFGFSKTMEKAHALENFFVAHKDLKHLSNSEEFESQCIELKKSFKDNMDFVTNNISEEWLQSESLSVSTQRIVEIEEACKSKYPNDTELLQMLQSLYFVRAAEVFHRFGSMARELMDKCGKKIKPVSIKGGDVLVPKESFFPLANVLTHIIRNMAYHGIEAPKERVSKKKDERGKISIEIASKDEDQENKHYSILISDDGKGIDFEKVKKEAEKMGLVNETGTTQAELVKLLFSQKISTASQINEVSGRGAGLVSVQQAVDQLSGKIHVKSKKDSGTAFVINIPHSAVMNLEK